VEFARATETAAADGRTAAAGSVLAACAAGTVGSAAASGTACTAAPTDSAVADRADSERTDGAVVAGPADSARRKSEPSVSAALGNSTPWLGHT
ncbi:hypothetical protein ACFWFQ_29825, partial [Nocardia salmonicida]|uniref:hypothetical protein n=1 Tax=Nocardia salmonicida TaxID=53431 RepID=UPI003661F7F0